jgi:hypothetical protein
MKQQTRFPALAVTCIGACLSWNAAAQPANGECDRAWTAYNEFRQHNVMEESQYARTTYGAAVRAACGKDALPVPPGTDTPRLPIVRKPPHPTAPVNPTPPRPRP